MPTPFKTIGLIGRHSDPPVRETLQNLVPQLSGRGVRILVSAAVPLDFAGVPVDRIDESEIPAHADLVISIGGDGTMLYAARLLADHDVPLLGINRGRLGFLADINPGDMQSRIDEVLDGNYIADFRLLLETEILRNADVVATGRALNDIVLQKLPTSRMLEFEISVDGHYVNADRGDGLIVATPTGSTAYALSGGGPILHPQLDAIVLVPICPHTLSDRPLVMVATRSVEVRLIEHAKTEADLIIDGFSHGQLKMGDVIRIRRASKRVTLIHPADYDYYAILRSKLAWGRGHSILNHR